VSTPWIIVLILCAIMFLLYKRKSANLARIKRHLKILPEHFIIADLETTGLDSTKDEIIEIGAIRVNRDSDHHETFQAYVRANKKIPKKITAITGITQAMIDEKGEPLGSVLKEFKDFVGDLRIVTYNAEFDMAFLNAASVHTGGVINFPNPVSCALEMARRAWPRRRSYRLGDISKDGGLSQAGTHRALGDCQRALTVYTAAVNVLGRIE